MVYRPISRSRRRNAVRHVQSELGISERRACRVLGQARSTQRYQSRKPEKDRPLVKRMHRLALENPRLGYRMITKLLVREGWQVNRKRVHRLWKQAGLQVPHRQRKKRRLGSSDNGCVRLKAAHTNHVWSIDFLFDRTGDGRQLKIMPVIDEFTRECLAIDVCRSINSQRVITVLEQLFRSRGLPANLRSDNGPEFIAKKLRKYLKKAEVKTRYIEPGAPWQNGYVESFNNTLRNELLNQEIFDTMLEARVLTEQYRRRYNEYRPHSSLNYATPSAYADGVKQTANPVLVLT